MKYLPWVISAVCLGVLGFTWQDSRTRLEQKDAELESLRGQYNLLVADANAKIEAANSKAKKIAEEANNLLKQQETEANEKLQQANLREAEVSVKFRKALLSSGHVAGFTNTSSQPVAIVAHVLRASTGQSRSFEMTLDPGRTKEVGEREGWAFLVGDKITVEQPDRKSLIFSTP